MSPPLETNGVRKDHNLLGLIFCLVLGGCSQSLAHKIAKSSDFGNHQREAEYCIGLQVKFDRDHSATLSANDIRTLEGYQLYEDRVAFQSTAVIGVYGTADPKLKDLLISRIDALLATHSEWPESAAVSVARWYKDDQHKSEFETLRRDLQGKADLNAGQLYLQQALDLYFKDEKQNDNRTK